MRSSETGFTACGRLINEMIYLRLLHKRERNRYGPKNQSALVSRGRGQSGKGMVLIAEDSSLRSNLGGRSYGKERERAFMSTSTTYSVAMETDQTYSI